VRFLTLVIGMHLSLQNAAIAQTLAPDLELMAQGLEALDKAIERASVPGLGADGERSVPGRFTAHDTLDDGMLLLDTASGRLWRIVDDRLLPIIEDPVARMNVIIDPSSDQEREENPSDN